MSQFLIELKADVNCRDEQGRTPLHYAALAGDGHMVSALFAEGVSQSYSVWPD